MDTWELTAREEIRELVASYTHLGDAGRVAEMTQLFLPDAHLEAHGRDFDGSEAIAAFFGGIADASKAKRQGPSATFMRHYITNLTIDVASPTEASGAAYWTVSSNAGFESSGRYRDTFRRQDQGPWRFATRKIKRDQ